MRISERREDLAWLAGFFEGEGSVRVSCPRPDWEITQVNLEPLQRGIGIANLGKIYGPYHNKKGRQSYYRWKIGSFEEVQAIVCALWPWLSARRKRQCKDQLVVALAHLRKNLRRFDRQHRRVL
jgi:hypothetical protein